jgi:hypothetical protein
MKGGCWRVPEFNQPAVQMQTLFTLCRGFNPECERTAMQYLLGEFYAQTKRKSRNPRLDHGFLSMVSPELFRIKESC